MTVPGTPRVSVILPTYNRVALLPRAIASVLNQSWADFELIVVDDRSGDDTTAVVSKFMQDDPRVRLVSLPQNLGDAGARNQGIAQARGEWLAFQDSDDEWLPQKLEQQMAFAQTLSQDFAAVGSSLLRFVAGRGTCRVDRFAWPLVDAQAEHGEVDRVKFMLGPGAWLQSLLVRRSAFDGLRGFETKLAARSDFDFCLRLLGIGRIAALTEVLALSYETKDSISMREDYRAADVRYILSHHSGMIEADRRVSGHFWYELAKVELLLGHRRSGMQALLKALHRRPGHALSWALLMLLPTGPAAVRGFIELRQRTRL